MRKITNIPDTAKADRATQIAANDAVNSKSDLVLVFAVV
jgi:hypothetical protein